MHRIAPHRRAVRDARRLRGNALGSIVIEAVIYNEHASSATQPGSALRDTSTSRGMAGGAHDMVTSFAPYRAKYEVSGIAE